MKVEVPKFGRCCMCIPLRYGLLSWGYLRLILSIMFFVSLLRLTILMTSALHKSHVITLVHFIILGVAMGILLIDVAFNVMFIVGGHKKNTHLLSIYYIYCIVTTAIFALILLILLGVTIHATYVPIEISTKMTFILKSELTSGIMSFVFQLYFIFLLRSEIIKLKNENEFRYVKTTDDSDDYKPLEVGNII